MDVRFLTAAPVAVALEHQVSARRAALRGSSPPDAAPCTQHAPSPAEALRVQPVLALAHVPASAHVLALAHVRGWVAHREEDSYRLQVKRRARSVPVVPGVAAVSNIRRAKKAR